MLGPVLTGFAEWTVARAHELGICRLGCLMREGAFLADLVNNAARYRSLPIEAEPLFLNRFIVDKASIGEATPAELAPFLGARNPATIAQVCRRLGIDLSDMPRFFAHADTRLDDFVIRQNFLEELSRTRRSRRRSWPTPASCATASAATSSTLPEGARRQSGSSTWAGPPAPSAARRRARQRRRAARVTGMYMLTHEGATQSVLGGTEVLGFLGNMGVPGRRADVMRSPEVLEQVLMPDHGTQIGLDENLEPELGREPDPPMQGSRRRRSGGGSSPSSATGSATSRAARQGRPARRGRRRAARGLPALGRRAHRPRGDALRPVAARREPGRGVPRRSPASRRAGLRYMDPGQLATCR